MDHISTPRVRAFFPPNTKNIKIIFDNISWLRRRRQFSSHFFFCFTVAVLYMWGSLWSIRYSVVARWDKRKCVFFDDDNPTSFTGSLDRAHTSCQTPISNECRLMNWVEARTYTHTWLKLRASELVTQSKKNWFYWRCNSWAAHLKEIVCLCSELREMKNSFACKALNDMPTSVRACS